VPVAWPAERNEFSSSPERYPMSPKKTLQHREKELQSLLTTPAGRDKLQELASGYQTESGKPRPEGTSAITYILVHERQQGLIGR
jgi:hypothetical protein